MTHHERLIGIMRQRERLLARCDAQRGELAGLVRQWEDPLKIADRAVAGLDYLRQHPLVLGAAVALLTVVQRRGLWSWVRRGFVLWRGYRAIRNSSFKLGA